MEVKKGQTWKFYLTSKTGLKKFETMVTSVKDGIVHHYHLEDNKKYWGKMPVDFFVQCHDFVSEK